MGTRDQEFRLKTPLDTLVGHFVFLKREGHGKRLHHREMLTLENHDVDPQVTVQYPTALFRKETLGFTYLSVDLYLLGDLLSAIRENRFLLMSLDLSSVLLRDSSLL